MIKIDRTEESQQRNYLNEIKIMERLKHKNIVNLRNFWHETHSLEWIANKQRFGFKSEDSLQQFKVGQGDTFLFIAMEYCPLNLEQWLSTKRESKTKIELLDILNQIVNGLRYIHSENLIHRDLKVNFNKLII